MNKPGKVTHMTRGVFLRVSHATGPQCCPIVKQPNSTW